MPAGIGSDTTVFGASTAPPFVAVTVYVTVPPGVNAPGSLDVFVMLTCGAGGFVTTTLHGGGVLPGTHRPPLGGVDVAMFVTLAGGFALTVATIV